MTSDTAGPDPMTAVLLQLAGLGQQAAALEERHAATASQLQDRLKALAAIVTDLKGTIAGHAEALTELDGRVAAPAEAGEAAAGPGPGPRWWKPGDPGRDEAITRLRSWTEEVYRPGYGYLAATLGECWDQHPLCLYVLDWLSGLWQALYLAPARTQAVLAGQAEWHARLLPAAAEQLARETRGCRHPAPRNAGRP